VMGLFSILTTKIVYFIEDLFEKLPIHWMWWPALGGLAVGIVGYFFPRTLGVGYNNITDILTGSLPVTVLISICAMKFISWAIALGSGTSGGTLAPLLTIGGAAGALLGSLMSLLFPQYGISIPLSALVGMSAMFAGASRAFLTSIVFALETTHQTNALLPLLTTSGAAYIVSYLLMKNTIMTEKIARRGIKTPDSYEPDLLENILVKEVMDTNLLIVDMGTGVQEAIMRSKTSVQIKYFVVVDKNDIVKGIINTSKLFSQPYSTDVFIESLLEPLPPGVSAGRSLRYAVEKLAQSNSDFLPVTSSKGGVIRGIVSLQNILSIYAQKKEDHEELHPDLSLSRGLKKIYRKSTNWMR